MIHLIVKNIAENILETISRNLKLLLAKYNTQSALGHLSFLMTCITNGSAQDELGKLISPMRQLYYLAGLLVTEVSQVKINERDLT